MVFRKLKIIAVNILYIKIFSSILNVSIVSLLLLRARNGLQIVGGGSCVKFMSGVVSSPVVPSFLVYSAPAVHASFDITDDCLGGFREGAESETKNTFLLMYINNFLCCFAFHLKFRQILQFSCFHERQNLSSKNNFSQ